MAARPTPDVLVVGGGIIGLAVAFRARQRGMNVEVVDTGQRGAWTHAAGMLAPITEAHPGEDALVSLSLRAAEAWPAFADEIGVPLRTLGTLAVARDADDAEALDQLHAHRQRLGLVSERLLPSRARRLEPALAPTIRLALDVPGDHAVDPRAVVAALRERVPVLDEPVDAPVTVIAAGAWTSQLLPEIPVRPVKGQVVRLRGPQLVDRTIRTLDAYLVPRGDGRYVLGATMEERGWDTSPTAGGVFELIRDMSEVVPGILEFEIEEISAGLRPATPDNLPALGWVREGVLVATGHHRNGILLAPLTADLVAAQLAGEELPGWASACDVRRFEKVPA
jgi:glycine oxidase